MVENDAPAAADIAENRKSFSDLLRAAINTCCMENASDTPDWILAEYLIGCLDNFTHAARQRDQWHSFKPWGQDVPVVREGEGDG